MTLSAFVAASLSCGHHVQKTHSALFAVQGLISLTTSPVIAAGIAGLATSATAHSAVEVRPGLLPSHLQKFL